MEFLINEKTNKPYAEEFISAYGFDVGKKLRKAISKLESGNLGNVSRINFCNEKSKAPLFECEVDYKQGFRIYFTNINGNKRVVRIGEKKTQKKDIAFCVGKFLNKK